MRTAAADGDACGTRDALGDGVTTGVGVASTPVMKPACPNSMPYSEDRHEHADHADHERRRGPVIDVDRLLRHGRRHRSRPARLAVACAWARGAGRGGGRGRGRGGWLRLRLHASAPGLLDSVVGSVGGVRRPARGIGRIVRGLRRGVAVAGPSGAGRPPGRAPCRSSGDRSPLRGRRLRASPHAADSVPIGGRSGPSPSSGITYGPHAEPGEARGDRDEAGDRDDRTGPERARRTGRRRPWRSTSRRTPGRTGS